MIFIVKVVLCLFACVCVFVFLCVGNDSNWRG